MAVDWLTAYANLFYVRKTSHFKQLLSSLLSPKPLLALQRCLSQQIKIAPFGLLLDIDGVLVRGKEIVPGVRQAFRRLVDERGWWHIPTVFVTNAGNVLRAHKAKQLSEYLHVPIDAEQVVMAHSPLRMFVNFHHKHVLVVGQGPVTEIAQALGFQHVTTVEQLRERFPNLDCVDHKRRSRIPCPCSNVQFKPIEAVVLFGEPVRWETSLQLVVDVLLTGGVPCQALAMGLASSQAPSFPGFVTPHLPVLACNMDLLWKSEACLPRFGHGTFLLCLESLYLKLTGHELKYTALMGKPSELTYHHAEWCVSNQAFRHGCLPPKTLYAIGDNPESDVLGANLFNQFLMRRCTQRSSQRMLQQQQQQGAHSSPARSMTYDFDMIDLADECLQDHGAEQCYSVLVETGVYSSQDSPLSASPAASYLKSRAKLGIADSRSPSRPFDHLPDNNVLKTPSFVEADFGSALARIFVREGLHSQPSN